MEKIIYEIDGQKYVLFGLAFKKEHQVEVFLKSMEKYNAIIQSYDIVESFWNGPTIKISVLVPEQYASLVGKISY